MIDAAALKSRVDLLALVGADTQLRKVASTNGGELAGPCPFCGGRDRFRVQPERGQWWCRQCSPDEHWQDAIAYVRRRDGLGFAEACARLGEQPAGGRAIRPDRPLPPEPSDPEPSASWRAAAAEVVARCSDELWSAAGDRARAWLNARGLTDATLVAWELGYSAGQEIAGLWVPRGIVIPWYAGGELWQVKIRRPMDRPKYESIKGGHPLLYGADQLAGRDVAVLVEGEFDALLLWQEAGDLVGVATLGSCSKALTARAMSYLLPFKRLLVAYDVDIEGEEGAARLLALSARMRRIRPLAGKDLTDFHTEGGNLRAWVKFHLDQSVADLPRGEP